MKHLYLMRHGETLFNVLRRIQGWCDSPLTEKGIQQAKDARKLIEGIQFDHYYCSTAERCSDTLELVAGNVPYTRVKGLKERYFACFEGQSEDLNPPFGGYDTVFPLYGGESSEDVKERLTKTLTQIMEKDDHECVLAVSHAGASMCFASGVFDFRSLGERFGNCNIMHFTYDDGKFEFVEILKN